MGYRSDVGLAISNKIVSSLTDEEANSIYSVFDDPKYVSSDGDRLYTVNAIKWYANMPGDLTGYEDVSAVDDLMTKWGNEELSEDFCFVRIGEEPDDIAYEGMWSDNPFNLGYDRTLYYIDPSADHKPDTVVVIEVQGGCVINASSNKAVKVVIVVHDNQDEKAVDIDWKHGKRGETRFLIPETITDEELMTAFSSLL